MEVHLQIFEEIDGRIKFCDEMKEMPGTATVVKEIRLEVAQRLSELESLGIDISSARGARK
jgi:hypothetical protein